MNLPLVIDVVLGLLFIYLTLSLLASEVQELIGTLLQWRAEHLKKSIENLVANEEFADRIYSTPLIKSLNQEAKGLFSTFFRRFSYVVSDIYHRVTRTRNVFGDKRSGPSYIPSEAFAIAILQQINAGELSRKISELAFRRFVDEKVSLVQDVLESLRNSLGDYSLLEDEFKRLKQSLYDLLDDFVHRRASLSDSIQQITDQLHHFIDNTEEILVNNNHCKEIVRRRLPYLKQTIALRHLEPTVAEVLSIIFNEGDRRIDAASDSTQHISPALIEVIELIRHENPELLQQIANLPDQLKQNLLTLAEQARLKADNLEAGVRQMEKEIATWFDNSMARASGVYRRNAKGVALIIGVIIAIVMNADTLYIVNRLSKDTALRTTLSVTANDWVAREITPEQFQNDPEAIRNQVEAFLDQVPLPIGWGEQNRLLQRQEAQNAPFPWLRKILGWGVTGFALSMGASFWYDLLGKIMRVRNSGRPEGDSSNR